MELLTNSIKKRFSKDFSLPINLFSEEHFNYFIELYDPVFKTKEKLNYLNSVLQECETQENFFELSTSISNNIKKLISESNAYKNFNNADLNQFQLLKNVSQQNIYIPDNIGKNLISIDLKKANFNSFRLFGLQDEIEAQSYEDLIKKFTKHDYFINSKMIRQVIFGDLNPSRQQRIQKYIIQNLCEKLVENDCEIKSASSDEIIIRNKNSIDEVKSMLDNVDEKFKFFRVEKFSISLVDKEHDFYIKKTINENNEEKIEFKNTPGFLFAQVYKKYFNMEINEYDKLFFHEGFLAEYKDPLFKKELNIKLKY